MNPFFPPSGRPGVMKQYSLPTQNSSAYNTDQYNMHNINTAPQPHMMGMGSPTGAGQPSPMDTSLSSPGGPYSINSQYNNSRHIDA